MPLLPLVLVFLVLPLAELYVIFKLADDVIGLGWTIALLVADSVLGALLLRSQGRAVWGRFSQALAEDRMPHREVQDGVLVFFGGAFLMTPGFITDVFGLLMLLPPTRTVIRRVVMRVVSRRVTMRVAAAGVPVEGSATEYPVATGTDREDVAPPRRLRR